MSILSRTDNSVVGRWWWTVDRWTIAALGLDEEKLVALRETNARRFLGMSLD